MNEFVPSEFNLSQNYPNPFSKKTTIKYCLAYKTKVRLTVFDENGNEIEKLVDEEKKAGTYEVEFHFVETGHPDRTGQITPFLLYRLEAGDYSSEKKMILENESSHTH